MGRNFGLILAGVAAMLLSACGVSDAASGNNDGWPMHGRNANEDRFSPLAQISDANVSRLGLAWFHEFDTDRGQESTPIVIGNRLYVSTAWSKVFAFDAATGKQIWGFDPKVDGAKGFNACCDVVNRGVAVDGDRLFVGTIDGRLIALDRQSGKQLWSVQTTDTTKPYSITGAPRVVKGKVVIGNSGAEYGVRGYVSAYDVTTGKMAWRFYTIPGDPAKGPDGAASDPQMAEATKTWFGKWHQYGGGGTVWDAIVYDEELDQLYIGVGNGGPYDRGVRSDDKGDNLFLASIVALNPDTGAYKWHYQEVPGETWDYTATQPIILATLPIDGRPRKVLMQAPKNGFFYVIDRTSGKLISANPYSDVTWAKSVDLATGRPVENPGVRWHDQKSVLVTPGAGGAHNWQPMAYSPKTQLVYIPVMKNSGMYYDPEKRFQYRPGAWNMALQPGSTKFPDDPAVLKKIIESRTGALVAWDPVAGKARWTVEHPTHYNGGILATEGNLVFQGKATGSFAAYSADAGKKLWEYPTGTGVIAGPVSYRLNGVQYVAVMAGFGGSAISSGAMVPQKGRRNGRLLVFKLDGKTRLPEYQVADPISFRAPKPTVSAEVIEQGRVAYAANCMVCHGPNAMGGILPDLRNSPAIGEKETFDAVLIDGALKDNGMISFKDKLTVAEIEAIRQYLMERSSSQP